MKFSLVTSFDEKYQPLAELTWFQNKKLYAEKYGYDAIAITDFKYETHLIGFQRLELMAELLESGEYNWLHWCGCDTMITNFNIKLEDLIDDDVSVILATDCHNINNDSFLIKKSPESIAWLKTLITLREKYSTHFWFDQQAMIDTIDMISSQLKIVPQRVINAYDYNQYPPEPPHIFKRDLFGNDGQWQPGDFLIQWPGLTLERRLQLAEQILPQVIK